MRQRYADIRHLSAELLVVTPGPSALLSQYAREMNLPCPVLCDAEGRVYRRYGLGRGSFGQVWGPRTLQAYAWLLLRGRRLKRPQGDLYRLGGDFVIDGEGIVRYAYRSREPTDRPAVGELLALLARHSRA